MTELQEEKKYDAANEKLNFQCQLPEADHKDEELEKKVAEFLSENGDYYKHWGDPILVILKSKWYDTSYKEDDEYELQEGKKIRVKVGQTYHFSNLDVSCICFNPEPEKEKKKLCNLTTFTLRGNSSKFEDWDNWYSLEWEPFDPRAFDQKIYNGLVEKYGKEIVDKSHLSSSEVSDAENELIEALKEIKRLWSKALTGRKQKEFVDKAYAAVKAGADPNLIIDDSEYRPLHYARFLNGSDYIIPFVKFMREHGADPNLGPIQTREIYGGRRVTEKHHITPWYFYEIENIMLKDGPLHKAIGGKSGGMISTTECECVVL